MNSDVQSFWNDVRRLWTPRDDMELHNVTHQVFLHLRRGLPPGQAQHHFSALPGELESLATEPFRHLSLAEQQGHRAAEELDIPVFYERVARDAAVPKATAMQATEAVFLALKRHLPCEAVDQIRRALPKRLKRVWLEVEVPLAIPARRSA